MTKFEDNLWREVEQKYGSELSEAPGPGHSRPLRGPVLAGTTLGIVGASTAAVLVLTAAGSSPAFAVTTQPNGNVSVVIRRIEGIPGANRRLAQLGIHARAVRVADGCQVLPPPGTLRAVPITTLVRNGRRNWIGNRISTLRAEIRPAQIPSGRTLVIPAVRAGRVVRLVRGRAIPGAVPACLPPTVQVWSRVKGGVVQTIACRGGIPLHAFPGRIVVRPPVSASGTETNTTATNAGPPPATATQTSVSPATTTDAAATTGAGTATDSGTSTGASTATDSGTSTGASTATDSGTSTSSGTTPSSTSPRSVTTVLPSPLVRACRLAGRAAAR
jgi:hypothetical protein